MNPSRNTRQTAPRPRRRDVLAYGAGLALLPSMSWATSPDREGLTIGYCPEVAAEEWPGARVTPAERLAAGDARLARGARITVHGLVGDDLAALGIRSAELVIGFPTAGTERADFRAWGHRLLPVENAGSAVAFTVPVEDGLRLALELEAFGVERREAVLVTGREPGAPKLRCGHYRIAFDPAMPETFLALSVEPA